MDILQKSLVTAVRDFARANYEMDGWDYIVECFDDTDILDAIGEAKTSAVAIREIGKIAKLHASVRADIEGEIF
jgi:hypothetical protein